MSTAANAKPQVFVVTQEGSYIKQREAKFRGKYEAVCKHLCEVIKLDGNLDLHHKKVKGSEEFESYLSDLREREVDPSRPFAFLFIAPEPVTSEENETYQDSIAEIASLTAGQKGDAKPSSSSVILMDRETNKGVKFVDHQNLLTKISKKLGNIADAASEAFFDLSHLSLTVGEAKLEKQIASYAKELINHSLQSKAKKPELREVVREEAVRTKKQECKYKDMSLKSYKPFVREAFKAVDWDAAIKYPGIAPSRIKVFEALKLVAKGLSFAEVAEKTGKRPKAVFDNVTNFLVYTADTFRKMEGFKTDRIVSHEKDSRNSS